MLNTWYAEERWGNWQIQRGNTEERWGIQRGNAEVQSGLTDLNHYRSITCIECILLIWFFQKFDVVQLVSTVTNQSFVFSVHTFNLISIEFIHWILYLHKVSFVKWKSLVEAQYI